MNGLDVLDHIKKDGKNPNLAFVILTTEGQPGLVERAKKSGAKGWVVKPFKPELLVATIRRLTTA